MQAIDTIWLHNETKTVEQINFEQTYPRLTLPDILWLPWAHASFIQFVTERGILALEQLYHGSRRMVARELANK